MKSHFGRLLVLEFDFFAWSQRLFVGPRFDAQLNASFAQILDQDFRHLWPLYVGSAPRTRNVRAIYWRMKKAASGWPAFAGHDNSVLIQRSTSPLSASRSFVHSPRLRGCAGSGRLRSSRSKA